MLRRLCDPLIILTLAAATPFGSAAQGQQLEEQAWLASQFEGWDGVAFYCETYPEHDILTSLCQRLGQRARLLVQGTGISLQIVSPNAFERFLQLREAGLTHALELVIEMKAVTEVPAALNVDVMAVDFYSDAVSQADCQANDYSVRCGSARAGDLVLWGPQGTIAAGGTLEQLSDAVYPHVETVLMHFLADFGEGQSLAREPASSD